MTSVTRRYRRVKASFGAILLITGALHFHEGTSAAGFPSYETLKSGPRQVRLLPGQSGFVFTLYGAPAELATVRELITVLRKQGLGNGFDPGPGPRPGAKPTMDYLADEHWPVVFYSGGEMQIKGGELYLALQKKQTWPAWTRLEFSPRINSVNGDIIFTIWRPMNRGGETYMGWSSKSSNI
jgi:hypothetical protein